MMTVLSAWNYCNVHHWKREKSI